MQISNKPSNLTVPFASGGSFNSIPVASQQATSPNKASYTDGFPPATRTLRAAGGLPPDGLDMNGILHDLSNAVMWQQGMGVMPWDSNFASQIGYPLNAIISYNGVLYQSQSDNNAAIPSSGTNWSNLLGAVANNILALNSPPSANLSMQGVSLGANYNNAVSLNFTPKTKGVVMAFGKINLASIAASGSNVSATLFINGVQVSGDSTIISQSHFATAVCQANTQSTITMVVTTGSTSPVVGATYGIAYIFIPTN